MSVAPSSAMKRHRARAPCLGMIFPENRFTLFPDHALTQQIFRESLVFAGKLSRDPRLKTGLTPFTLQCHMTAMNKIKTVCVYCGSSPGTNPRFIEAAAAFGKILAEN